MIVVVVLDMHLVHPMIDECEILMIVHLIRVSLVSRVYVLLILLQSPIGSATTTTHHLLLLTTTVDLLQQSEEVAIVDNIVK